MITRVVQTIQRPFYWFLLQTTRDRTWQRYRCQVPLHIYGAGSRKKFSWYLDGDLDSRVMDIKSIKHWLTGCQYVKDDVLFNERDVWQHPITFERLRKGDCEDFSLWVWRKLIECGYEAEFVAGWTIHPGEEYRGHTWVLFKEEEQQFLFDAVATDKKRMVRTLEDVSEWYVPQVSVDYKLTRYVYGGYYSQLKPIWKGMPATGTQS